MTGISAGKNTLLSIELWDIWMRIQ